MKFRMGAVGLFLFGVVSACTGAQQATTTTETPPITSTTANTQTTTTEQSSTTTNPAASTTTIDSTTTTLATNPSPPTTTGEQPPSDNQAPSILITGPAHLSSHQAELNEAGTRFGATVTFTADASDPDGEEFTIEWFSDDEGFLGTGESLTVELHTIHGDSAQPTITARATDKWGTVSDDSIQIIIWIPSDT